MKPAHKIFERSLLLRLGIAMTAIALLALVAMLSSIFIAEMTTGNAAAINQAGSLRMQSYRLATLLQAGAPDAEVGSAVRRFESDLAGARLIDVLPQDPAAEPRASYENVVSGWRTQIKPVLVAYLNGATGGKALARERYVRDVGGFVTRVNALVALLEQDTESNIRLLRLIQGISLFLTLVVVFVTMYLMHADVLAPLRDLLLSAERAGRGDLSARVAHQGADELGRLGRAFNIMAEELAKLYAGLESRVAAKTADLKVSNRSLQLLYDSISRLNEAPGADSTYRRLLRDIEQSTDVDAVTICLNEGVSEKLFIPIATVDAGKHLPELCTLSDCEHCLGDGDTRLRLLTTQQQEHVRVLSVPLKDRNEVYGVLLLQSADGRRELNPQQIQLVEALARHIGVSMGAARRSAQSRRLALLEERGVIARELHDSLAQSLSYLKIQIARLQSALAKQPHEPSVDAVVQELREGLNSAYRQLRELLTTFRLQMDGRGLGPALQDTVAEFAAKGTLPIALDNRLGASQLSVNEELSVLQIVREALSNVLHHARASRAEVTLRCSEDGVVGVSIDDDGVGIDLAARPAHHYGVIIMNDRARELGAQLDIARKPEGGTHVELRFTPTANRNAAAAVQRHTA